MDWSWSVWRSYLSRGFPLQLRAAHTGTQPSCDPAHTSLIIMNRHGPCKSAIIFSPLFILSLVRFYPVEINVVFCNVRNEAKVCVQQAECQWNALHNRIAPPRKIHRTFALFSTLWHRIIANRSYTCLITAPTNMWVPALNCLSVTINKLHRTSLHTQRTHWLTYRTKDTLL